MDKKRMKRFKRLDKDPRRNYVLTARVRITDLVALLDFYERQSEVKISSTSEGADLLFQYLNANFQLPKFTIAKALEWMERRELSIAQFDRRSLGITTMSPEELAKKVKLSPMEVQTMEKAMEVVKRVAGMGEVQADGKNFEV
jgi:regulation of enolase protein 1 (concanavalin A-like superfamily)